jgi:hypothetical protein
MYNALLPTFYACFYRVEKLQARRKEVDADEMLCGLDITFHCETPRTEDSPID